MLKYLMGTTALRAPEGEGAGGTGTPPADNTGGTGDKPLLTADQLKEFTTGLTSLKEDLAQFGVGLKELVQLAKDRNAAGAGTGDPEPDEVEVDEGVEIDPTALETLPRAQFMDLMLRNFQKHLTGALKPIEDKISQVGSSAQTRALMEEGEKVMAKNPDFKEWGDEMKALAAEHPSLGIGRLLTLARAENPDKAAKMAEKYKKKDDSTEEKPGNGKSRAKPFAMAPGSGGTSETKNQKMKPDDAAQAAWDETVAKLGSPFGG